MSEMLPCPFCGTEPLHNHVENTFGEVHSIDCVNAACGVACTVANGVYDEALTAWNTRALGSPHGAPPSRPSLRFARPVGLTLSQMTDNIRASELYRAGDTVLIWVNEGDLWASNPTQFAAEVADDLTLTEEVARLRKVVAESGGLAPGVDERFAASTVEPVAWRWRATYDAPDDWSVVSKKPGANEHRIIEPLYAAPTTSPEPDAVREALRAIYEWYDRDGSVGAAADVFEDHRGAVTAALSRPAHGGWEDISTAPKDREILAVRIEWWKPENGNHRWIHSQVRQTKWDAERQRFGFDHEKQPTHWTEVPAIPALPIPRNDRGSEAQ